MNVNELLSAPLPKAHSGQLGRAEAMALNRTRACSGTSPLGWDHLVLTEDYDWNSGAAQRSNVRPLNPYSARIRV